MQVILLEKVANLGQLGEVVKVKPGYARLRADASAADIGVA